MGRSAKTIPEILADENPRKQYSPTILDTTGEKTCVVEPEIEALVETAVRACARVFFLVALQ